MNRSQVAGSAPPDAISFPHRNPNPVLRIDPEGVLAYANEASRPILTRLGVEVGDAAPSEFLGNVVRAAGSEPPGSFELACALRTFEIIAVNVNGGGYNVYGTDITGAKVVEKFPDRNPNPVMRADPLGRLLYANTASAPIVRALGTDRGEQLPQDFWASIVRRLAGDDATLIEVQGEGRTFAISPVEIPEFGFTNLYGTDVTAARAMTSFPDENPHPVMRVSQDSILVYANPASQIVLDAFGIQVGSPLPDDLMRRCRKLVDGTAMGMIEIEHDGRVIELRVVSVYEYESINLYGTDVTAARQVEKANAENERLLLNILPASIADRLRHGEEVIADAFDEMAVLFADVVEFTPFSVSHPAREVVGVLNEIFSIFDRLVDKHDLEKIKTVGDAYMAVGGLSPGRGDALDVVDMALDMVDEMRRYRPPTGDPMEIRVGVHVGPGIGGVIGLKKFIYDVWGDTVNTASRMESHGVPGRIQITAETADRLRGRYVCERRGIVDIKGKGPIETYFLVRRSKARRGGRVGSRSRASLSNGGA